MWCCLVNSRSPLWIYQSNNLWQIRANASRGQYYAYSTRCRKRERDQKTPRVEKGSSILMMFLSISMVSAIIAEHCRFIWMWSRATRGMNIWIINASPNEFKCNCSQRIFRFYASFPVIILNIWYQHEATIQMNVWLILFVEWPTSNFDCTMVDWRSCTLPFSDVLFRTDNQANASSSKRNCFHLQPFRAWIHASSSKIEC